MSMRINTYIHVYEPALYEDIHTYTSIRIQTYIYI